MPLDSALLEELRQIDPSAASEVDQIEVYGREQAKNYVPLEEFKNSPDYLKADEDQRESMLEIHRQSTREFLSNAGTVHDPKQIDAIYEREKRLAQGADTGWIGDKVRRVTQSAITGILDTASGLAGGLTGGEMADFADPVKKLTEHYIEENPNMDEDFSSDIASGIGSLIAFGVEAWATGGAGSLATKAGRAERVAAMLADANMGKKAANLSDDAFKAINAMKKSGASADEMTEMATAIQRGIDGKMIRGGSMIAASIGLEYKAIFDQTMEATGDVQKSHAAALKGGVPAGMIEFLADSFLLNRIIKPFKPGQKLSRMQLAGAIAQTPLVEGGEEMVQGFIEDWASRSETGLERFDPFDPKKRFREFAVGAVIGSLGSVRPTYELMQSFKHPDKEVDAEANAIAAESFERAKFEPGFGEDELNEEEKAKDAELQKKEDSLADLRKKREEGNITKDEEEALAKGELELEGMQESFGSTIRQPDLVPNDQVGKPAAKIAGIAIRDKNGIKAEGKIGQIHADLMMEAIANDLDLGAEQHVFVDEAGNALDRKQAFQVAKVAGQLNSDGLEHEQLAQKEGREPELQSQYLLSVPIEQPTEQPKVEQSKSPEEQRAEQTRNAQRAAIESEIADLLALKATDRELFYGLGKEGSSKGTADLGQKPARLQTLYAKLNLLNEQGQTSQDQKPLAMPDGKQRVIVSDKLTTAKRAEVEVALAEMPEKERAEYLKGIEFAMPMFAAENIVVETGENHEVEGKPDGTIVLRVGKKPLSYQNEKTSGVIADEEASHIAHYIYLRNQWLKQREGGIENFAGYLNQEFAKIGLEATGLLTKGEANGLIQSYWLKFKFNDKQAQEFIENARNAFMAGDNAPMARIGSEMFRAALQRARTGKLSEDLRAIHGGENKKFVQVLKEALTRWRDAIVRFLDPRTAPKNFQMQYNGVVDLLRSFGVIEGTELEDNPIVVEEPKVIAKPAPKEVKPLVAKKPKFEKKKQPVASDAKPKKEPKPKKYKAVESPVSEVVKHPFKQKIRKDEPPIPEGMTRIYHGGTVIEEGSKRWFSQYRDYAEGYARKSGEAGKVYYLDIPVTSDIPKSFDDSGTSFTSPFVNFEATAEMTAQAKELPFEYEQAKIEKVKAKRKQPELPATSGASPGETELSFYDRFEEGVKGVEFSKYPSDDVTPKPRTRTSKWTGMNDDTERDYDQKMEQVTHVQAREAIEAAGGTIAAARKVVAGRYGEVLREEGIEAPLEVLHAIYGQLDRRLADLERRVKHSVVPAQQKADMLSEIASLERRLVDQMATSATEGGRMVQILKNIRRWVNGRRAKQGVFDSLEREMNEKLGRSKDKESILKEFRKATKHLRQLAINKAVSRGELLKVYQKIIRWAAQPESIKRMKQVVSNGGDLASIIREVIVRASPGEDLENGESREEQTLRNIMAEVRLAFAGHVPPGMEELMWRAVEATVKNRLNEAGLIPDSPTPRTPIQRLGDLMNMPPDAWQEFVTTLTGMLHEKNAQENFPVAPGTIEAVERALASKIWNDRMIERTISQAMKTLELKLPKIIRSAYAEQEDGREKIAAEIMKEMPEMPEWLARHLASDIESTFNERVNQAREKMFGSRPGVSWGLGKVGSSIKALATSHNSLMDAMDVSFARYMADNLALPPEIADQLQAVFAAAMRREVEKMRDERHAAVLAFEGIPFKPSKLSRSAVIKKILGGLYDGTLTNERTYNILAHSLGLPAFTPQMRDELVRLGDEVADMPEGELKYQKAVELATYIASQRGVPWGNITFAVMYSHMLSGIPTHLVNLISNAASLIMEAIGHVAKSFATANPHRAIKLLAAIGTGLMRGGVQFAAQAWRTGITPAKMSQKLNFGAVDQEFQEPHPFEVMSRDSAGKSLPYRAIAKYGKLMRYVTRAMSTVDMAFFKMAQNMAFVSQGGELQGAEGWRIAQGTATEDLHEAGITEANPRWGQMLAIRTVEVYEAGNRSYTEKRAEKRGEEFNSESAWKRSGQAALEYTFNNDPVGWIGTISKLLARASDTIPPLKVIVPFTRVVANVLNRSLDFSPIGLGRAVGAKIAQHNKSDRFKEWQTIDGAFDWDRANRAFIGTTLLSTIAAAAALHVDDDDPYFMVSGAGPLDADEKQLLFERGWRPYTVKIGDKYWNYLYTPINAGLGAIGAWTDSIRSGKKVDPDKLMLHTALSMFKVTLSQSFLSGLGEVVNSIYDPNGVDRLTAWASRTGTNFVVPNIVKHMDRYIYDPTVMDADTASQHVLAELPALRQGLKPRLNRFGEPIKRAEGFAEGMIGSRIVAFEKIDDPVVQWLAHNRIMPPSYEGNFKVGDRYATREEKYLLVKHAGPKIHEALVKSLPELDKIRSKEEKEEAVKRIASAIKSSIRRQIKSGQIK